ncbi:hypothetical protein [Mycolicibacterium cosmeticum]|uniref:hypothetical protein n=1 Tax=Mycolicibacterium cosmeticum TaxID=258533 RepID=UPI003204BB76
MFAVLAAPDQIASKDALAPLAAVCGAAIAAFVAWFNGRKTPSDRLQALLQIHGQWPEQVSGKAHITALIGGQLGEMWHRWPHLGMDPTATDISAEISRAGRRHLFVDAVALLISVVAIGISAWLTWPIDQAHDVEIIIASLIGGFALVIAVTRGIRIARHWL